VSIDAVIEHLLAIAAPSSGENMLGFVIDLDHALFERPDLTEPHIRATDDPRCLVVAETAVGDSVQSLQEIAAALRDVWDGIAYKDFEASSCVWYEEATVLRFATCLERGHLFVTGRIVVSGGPYPMLVESYNRDFGWLRGPLPSLRQTG
jgi:hypothetical protein